MSTVLGVYVGHDPAVCLLRDGVVVAMIEEERLTRVKHAVPASVRYLWRDFGGRFGYFPWAAVAYCLDAGGLGIDELDAIVLPHEETDATRMIDILPLKDRARVLVSRDPAGGAHHYRHALSAFLASPFERAAVLVVDGDGTCTDAGYEAETGYRFAARDAQGEEVFKNRYPSAGLRAGLGWAYEYVSALLGFVSRVGYLGEPGKTMGLAPLGGPDPRLAEPWIVPDGYRLDFSAFHRWLERTGHAGFLRFDTPEHGLVRNPAEIGQEARNLAWKVQHELERALLHLAGQLARDTGEEALCLAGGVALNSVANGLIQQSGAFGRVYIQPAAHDAGQALGLAFWGQQVLNQRPGATQVAIAPVPHAFGGRPYAPEQIQAVLKASGLRFEGFRDEVAAAHDAARTLASGKFVGWFQGGSEYGPRALGHRSILADPRGPTVKDVLNARVKFREGFRPFAPSVLRERAGEVFELEGDSPYMLLVVPVREPWRERVPAVTHVDGTARVQTVDAAVDPIYHALIEAFADETGVPLVLNTSFNLRGMPIVESPEDALGCFLYTELDALYLGRFKVHRPQAAALFPKVRPGWRVVVENRVSWTEQSSRARIEREDGAGSPVEVPGELVGLLAHLDGQTSLQAAAAKLLRAREPDPARVEPLWRGVQRLLRAGALVLRVGSLEL